MPARLVTGMVLAAVVVLHGPASAQQAESPAPRRKRADYRVPARRTPARASSSPARSPATPAPGDPAAEKARQLLQSIDWQEAPEIAGLGTFAEFRLPRGYVFTGAKGGKAFLDVTHDPAPKNFLGILGPYGSYDWFVIFDWKEGLRKDESKAKPDADALLKALRAENEADNATRRARGWAERTDLEWEKPPAYDAHNGNLTWTIRAKCVGRPVIRTTTRIFGKRGAIDAQAVARPDHLATVGNTMTNFLALVEFTDGPNGGMRREDLGGGGGGSSSSSGGGVTYVPTSTYSAGATTYSGGATRSIARSPRTIGGFITAFCGAIGAAFRRKKKSTA